ESGYFFSQSSGHFSPQLPELFKRDWRFNLKIQLAFDHIFSASLFQDSSQLTGIGKTECFRRIRTLWRHVHRSVYRVCNSRKEGISFLWTPDDKGDVSILDNHS